MPSDALYRSIFTVVPQPLFVLRGSLIVDANDGGRAIVGMPPGSEWLSSPGSDSGTSPLQCIQDAVRAGESILEFSPEETGRPARYRLDVCALPGDEDWRIAILHDEVDAQVVAEELRQERDFAAMILRTVRSLVVVLDSSGRVVSFNRASEVATGFSASEVEGSYVWDLLVPEEDREGVKEAFRDLASTGLPSTHENHWLTKDGGRRLISWSNACLRGSDGGIQYIMGTGLDITESRRSQEERERLTERLSEVIEVTRRLLGVGDPDLLLRRAVELARDRLGVERCGIFLERDGAFHGTYGTDMDGNTTDERSVWVEAGTWREGLKSSNSETWWLEDTERNYWRDGEDHRLSTGWVAVTPIRSAGDPVGFIFNDTAISGAPVDESVQQALALYASALGVLIERARATADLTRTRALLSTAIQASPVGILIADAAHGRLTIANRAAVSARQADPSTLTDIPLEEQSEAWEIFRPDGTPAPWEELPLSRAIRRGEVVEDEHYIIGRDDEARWISASAAPVTDGTDKTIAGIAVFLDITERRLITEALRESEREKSVILDSMADPVIYLSTDHRVLWANGAAARQEGCSAQELVGKRCPHQSENRCAICAAAMTFQTGRPEAVEYSGHDGRIWHIRSYPVKGRDGSVHGAVEISRDITAQRHAEEEQTRLQERMNRAQRLESLGVLAGGIAHDFNNILGAIMGYSELAMGSVDDDHPARSCMSEVLRASERAKDLVGQILAFSRRAELEQRPVLLAPIVTEALQFLRATLPATITIRQDIRDHDSVVLADSTQLHQVIMNLGTNAHHAMGDSGGVLSVSLSRLELGEQEAAKLGCDRTGAFLRLTVADSGTGMPPEVVERIFDPFFSTKSEGEGTGLGLSTVHGIVGSHGGAIAARSAEGEGSVFEVFLPRFEAIEFSEKSPDPNPRYGAERVLFVDDEESLAQMNKEMLENLGYQVTAVHDSRKALELVRESPDRYDIVVTDYTMPGLTGVELLQRVHELRPDMPAIIVTGHTQGLEPQSLVSIGVMQVLAKPYSLGTLASTVRNVLDEV